MEVYIVRVYDVIKYAGTNIVEARRIAKLNEQSRLVIDAVTIELWNGQRIGKLTIEIE